MARTKTIRSADELIAVVPHILGFHPEESLAVLPLSTNMPFSRIDLPTTPAEASANARSLTNAYRSHSSPGSTVALVCFTEDQALARQFTDVVRDHLAAGGIGVAVTLSSDNRSWTDLDTGSSGPLTASAAARFGAEQVAEGRATPASSRDAVAASFVGPASAVAETAAALENARVSAAGRDPEQEREWAAQRLIGFHHDGARLSAQDAARLLVAVADKGHRDALWFDMGRENADSHAALWSDLTRRAPDEARTPAAALAGWAHWLRGDGASAWCALDRIPPDQAAAYPMARTLTRALETAVNPRTWDEMKQTIADSITGYEPSRPGTALSRAAKPSHNQRDRAGIDRTAEGAVSSRVPSGERRPPPSSTRPAATPPR